MKQHPKTSSKTRTIVIALSALALLVFAAFALPFALPNGVDNYKGIQKEVAKNSIDRAVATTDGMTDPLFTAAHVDSIYAGPPTVGKCFSSIAYSEDPEKLEHYGAKVTLRTLFGIGYKTLDYHICQDVGR